MPSVVLELPSHLSIIGGKPFARTALVDPETGIAEWVDCPVNLEQKVVLYPVGGDGLFLLPPDDCDALASAMAALV